jgi:hypothetical protein
LIVAAYALERSEVPGCTVITASSGACDCIADWSALPEQEAKVSIAAEKPVNDTTRHNLLVIFFIV